jgi:hypothetical protein
LAALQWLTRGHGYEITALDIWGVYHSTLKAAGHLRTPNDSKSHTKELSPRSPPAASFAKSSVGSSRWHE